MQLDYWTQALAGLPDELALPADRPRPAAAGDWGEAVGLWLVPGLHARLRVVALDHGVTLFMVLQAGLAALLSRLGAGTDIPLGSPTPARNTLVLRTDVSGDPSFAELLARVRETDLAAYANQDVPFERLVEVLNPARSVSRHPLFQVMLAFGSDLGVGQTARYDLAVVLSERTGTDGMPRGIAGTIEFASDLFDRETVLALAARLVRLLDAAVGDPHESLSGIDILLPHEKQRIAEWSMAGTRPAPGSAGVLHSGFFARAAADPSRVAAIFGSESRMTYGELASG